MNNDSDRLQQDQELSRAYKALASETVPDAINQNILRMAAAESTATKPAGGFLALWSKPLAWAATIGLSLVIVLEVSQPLVPQVPTSQATTDSMTSSGELRDDADGATTDAAERSVREEFAPQSLNAIEEANHLVELQAGPNLSEADNVPNIVDQPSTANIAREVGGAQAEAPMPTASAAAADAYASIESETKALAKSARSRQDSLQVSRCDTSSQASATLWAACIEDLRKTGDKDAVDREIELLRIKFPAYAAE